MLKKFSLILSSTLCFLFIGPKALQAAGLFLTNGYTQVAPASVAAAIIFDGDVETILESVTFNHNPLVVWSFIWLIPVPSEPKVEFINHGFFSELDKLTQTKFKKKSLLEKTLYFDIEEEKNIPPEVFSRNIDFLRLEVFGPEKDFFEVERIFTEMGYLVPKAAKSLIQEYQKMGWYLISAEVNGMHIQMNATDSLSVYGASTFPIKISFKTDKPIYPLKFSSIPPDVDSRQIPVSFDYGISSQQVLGEKVEVVDALLSSQSQNQFPFLPLDYTNLKIDVFVFSDRKSDVDDFTTIYADRISPGTQFIDSKGNSYLELSKETSFLTRLVSFRPLLQLEDLNIEEANNSKRVNPKISTKEKIARVSFLVSALTLIIYLLARKLRLIFK